VKGRNGRLSRSAKLPPDLETMLMRSAGSILGQPETIILNFAEPQLPLKIRVLSPISNVNWNRAKPSFLTLNVEALPFTASATIISG